MTLADARLYVSRELERLAAEAGKAVHVVDVHSIEPAGDQHMSVWFNLDQEDDCQLCLLINADEVAGLDRAALLEALV